MTGEAWLGDVARAARALGTRSPEDLARIAALLGMGGSPAEPAPTGREEAAPDAPAWQAPAQEEDAGRPRPDTDQSVFGRRDEPARSGTVTVLVPVDERSRPAHSWTTPSLPRPRGRGEAAQRPPHLPLLAPRSTAALLTMVLSRVTPEGELDVDRATEELARARPLTAIPRRPLPTLRYGVQILADTSGAMEPFARDVEDVISHVRALAGVAGTQVLRFADVPSRGAGPGARATWQRPYRPPRPGVRVLILSDLGAGGPALNPWRATEQEWRTTIDTIRQRGCEPVALVPLPERYLPRWARGLLPMLTWDRGTTVGKALGARR
ncbi:hypothetical protein [Streptomyces sp. NRRL S-646]|uniref:hypothetical protein n=1 Tax=Streptomyces sp. NRRL S-646 TaxID=1463917 RepID=UPI00068DEBE4|nr:hypothetical protein [Streptomyces sp. NRRL S-646]